MRFRVIRTLLIIVALTGEVRSTHATCLLPDGVIHETTTANCDVDRWIDICFLTPNSTFAGLPWAAVELQILTAIQTWNKAAGANVFLHYFRRLASDYDAYDCDVIIREASTCGACDQPAMACSRPEYGWTLACGADLVVEQWNMYVQTNPSCWNSGEQGNTWAIQGTDAPAPHPVSIGGMIVHELGHTLSLNHPENCGQCSGLFDPPCGTMDSTTRWPNLAMNISRWDMQEIVAAYGSKSRQIKFRESTTALSWTVGSPAIPADWTTMFPPSSVSSDETVLGLAWNTGYTVHFGKGDTVAWFYDTAITGTLSYDSPAVAVEENDPHEFLVAYTSGEQSTSMTKSISLARSVTGGASWTTMTIPGSTTDREGVTVHHDPNSGRYLIAWLDSLDRLVIYAYSASAGTGTKTTLSDQGIDPPSIACRAGSGIKNCIMVWAGIDNNHCVNTIPFRVEATGALTRGTKVIQCFSQESGPHVTHQQSTASTFPWKMAFLQTVLTNPPYETDIIYTFRRGTADNAAWTDQRQFSDSGRHWPPTIGTLRNGSGAEEVDVCYGNL